MHVCAAKKKTLEKQHQKLLALNERTRLLYQCIIKAV